MLTPIIILPSLVRCHLSQLQQKGTYRTNQEERYRQTYSKAHSPSELRGHQRSRAELESEDCSIGNTFCISRLDKSHSHPFTTEMEINGKTLRMEIDTGSIISEQLQKQIFPKASVEPSPLQLQTYTGEKLGVIGQIQVTIRHHAQEKQLALHIVSGSGPSLLGRDWLKHIQLDWKTIGEIHMQRQAPALQGVLMKYADIFADELGTMQVTLQVREDAKPRFCKARSVPFATKEAIEAELDRLESCGILEKVDYSLWAAPIVAVTKKDGKIRICGDYKVTVNQSLEVDQYPLPKPDELFASLARNSPSSTYHRLISNSF